MSTEAQKKASIKWQAANMKRVPFDVRKDYYEEVLKPAVKEAGMTVGGFIKAAIEEKIERDGLLQDRETDRADDPLLDGPDEELPPFDL